MGDGNNVNQQGGTPVGADPKPGSVTDPKPGGGTDPAPKPKEKTYTQADVDKLLADQKKKYEGKMSEAEKLANMTAEEKEEYEAQQRVSDLEKREKAVALKELKQTAIESLSGKGLDTSLESILDYTDADSVNRSIKTVEKVIKAAIEKGIDDKLKASGGAPKTGNRIPTDTDSMKSEIAAAMKRGF